MARPKIISPKFVEHQYKIVPHEKEGFGFYAYEHLAGNDKCKTGWRSNNHLSKELVRVEIKKRKIRRRQINGMPVKENLIWGIKPLFMEYELCNAQ
ncbi:hypothetical protein SAMN05660772_02826 [Pasteurella testudinis DSM 23072]|uniref:Uncharacterized protein n=1 Tax=Pasteurella testudinis DSM 23072 TaxID=1122938 RepID=A0A1W1V5H0_9PAST|nr:hypothetical protein [Pasteurella testudinis]SMB88543.1 hypothetical protein SAMN05660772_02826 [Pasteurella testudinis DSM 23072]SUB51603.1 Uncharacterised protein [Pasteurella testudinis]